MMVKIFSHTNPSIDVGIAQCTIQIAHMIIPPKMGAMSGIRWLIFNARI
jgi:hypothetical protein